MLYTLNAQQCTNFELSSHREWILTNGIGGYAMGTVSGVNTRRYHGHLVAALAPPLDRTVLLANVQAFIQSDGPVVGISCNQYPEALNPEGYQYIQSFSVDSKVARWYYRAHGMEVVKSIGVHEGENSVTICYTNVGDKPISLTLQPLVSHKTIHGNFHSSENYPQVLESVGDKTTIGQNGVSLFLIHPDAEYVPTAGWYYRFEHLRDLERGLDPRDDLFNPCELRYELQPREAAVLIASTESDAQPFHFTPLEKEKNTLTDALKEAAAKFLVRANARVSIIAGYPWFSDYGRDSMISLPGICLHTGHIAEAREIILSFAKHMKQGLIPNRFLEASGIAEYMNVDGTLWFVNAIYKTLLHEWDQDFAERCHSVLEEVYHWHKKGTYYGIIVDPTDGLLRQGEPGQAPTWMDSRLGDWVITPRYGKPIEINGLWINALRIMEWLSEKLGKSSDIYREAAELAESHFEKKFWRDTLGYYLDVVDPDDASLRPNQVLAMGLTFCPMNPEHVRKAFEKIDEELLTPCGLRTLSPKDANYRGKYRGILDELDLAYHQGTVWPWLLGSYVSALVKFKGDVGKAKRILMGAREWLIEYGIGGIAEVYDGDEPRLPNGCPWQAWSAAEILRAWVEDVEGK